MPGIIVPRKCIGELRKLLDEVDGSVQISLSASKIRFGLGSAILTSKLIEGTFPDYNRLIPTANDQLPKTDARNLVAGGARRAHIPPETHPGTGRTTGRENGGRDVSILVVPRSRQKKRQKEK